MKLKQLLLWLTLVPALGWAGPVLPSDVRTAYRERVNEVLEWRAELHAPGDPQAVNLAAVAARLALRREVEWCNRAVIELMQAPTGDMFWMFPVVTVAFLGRDQLSPEAQLAIREAWRTYMPMRGDTENHWAMYYTSLYLMAELYPNEPGERWFTGKSSEENQREAREYLLHWMDLTTTIGQGEYDATHYIGEYSIPMLHLATWARDPVMRQRGQMMLDYVMADFAADTLDGMYIGAHSRANDLDVLEKWNKLSTFFAWLFFGNTYPPASYGGWGLYFAATAKVSPYEIPEVIRRIATERDGPYLHREVKRTRHRWRNSDVRNAPVYKQSYVTDTYAVGSSQGGMLQPIQQHTWSVTWAAQDPRGVHNALFTLHPYYSAWELQMYFTEFPDFLAKAVTTQNKPTYLSPDKFLGGSPHEQVFQDLDAVIALYDIPPDTNFEHINGFFSKDLVRLEEDASGWIFVQGGDAYIAYRPLAPYEWRPLENGGRRLYSPHRKNGAVVQTAAADEFEGWEAFKRAIRALPIEFAVDPKPRVRFTSLRGRRLEFAYDEAPRVGGEVVDYSTWKLFEGPWLNADLHSRKLELTHGPLRRVLDFETESITDSVRETE